MLKAVPMLEERISVPADFFSRLTDRIEGLGDFLELETSSRSPNACLRPSPLTDNSVYVGYRLGSLVSSGSLRHRAYGLEMSPDFHRSYPHCRLVPAADDRRVLLIRTRPASLDRTAAFRERASLDYIREE